MSDSLDDPFVQDLIGEFGVHGYLLWFGLIEIMAKESGNDLTKPVVVSERYFRKKLHTSSAKADLFLTFCVGFGKVLYKKDDNKLIIEMPKMLNIRDNHTKNLQATGKLVSLDAEKEVEEDKEAEKEKREDKPLPLPKVVSEKCIEKMEKEFPSEDVQKNLQCFYDYLPNKKRPYKDLDAAFRNCMRKAWYSFKKSSGDKYDAR